jgi:Holliday junction resolvase RusA-like endonuclease
VTVSAQLSLAINTPRIYLHIPGEAVGKGRARATVRDGYVHHYTPAKTENYEALVALAGATAMAGQPPINEPIDVLIRIGVPIRPSWTKAKQAAARAGALYPTTKPDLDNTAKTVFDGLNAIVWRDDVIIVTMLVAKRYVETPGVDVTVLPGGSLLTATDILPVS